MNNPESQHPNPQQPLRPLPSQANPLPLSHPVHQPGQSPRNLDGPTHQSGYQHPGSSETDLDLIPPDLVLSHPSTTSPTQMPTVPNPTSSQPSTSLPQPASAPRAGPKSLEQHPFNSRPSQEPASEPTKKRGGKRLLLAALIGLPIMVGTVIAGVVFLPGLLGWKTARPDLILHTVESEMLPLTVVERGALESSDNREVVCKVKAGARGTFASSIKWVIDDGSSVTKGQPILDLDDSALRDQEQQQLITVAKSQTAWIKAKEELEIQFKVNASDIASRKASLEVAELDLDKYLGIEVTPRSTAFGSVFSSMAAIEEKGEFRMKLDDTNAQLKLAESDLEAYRERSSWADRSVRSGYLTASQAKAEQSKYASAVDKLEKLRKEKFALENYTRPRELTDLQSKVKVAQAASEQAILQSHAKTIQAESETSTANSVYLQEVDKLGEIREQLRQCKLVAPQDGMVVYYKDPNSRFGGGNAGLIAVGEQVKEGQKLIRIPDLKRMQVTAKIHEALVSKIRGDDRRPTGVFESTRAAMLLNPSGFSRVLMHSEWSLDHVRDSVRDKEYYIAREGQTAIIRVDSFPDRVFTGRVKSVAAVASQADWNSSDVKQFPTIVSIEDTDVFGLRPDMSAEVTIQVDNQKEKVLTVPIQAIVGTSEQGSTRKVYVMENGEAVERNVELGTSNDRKAEVRKGLKEGEQVVLNPRAILGDKAKGVRDEGDATGRGAGKGKAGGQGKSGGGGAPPAAGGGATSGKAKGAVQSP